MFDEDIESALDEANARGLVGSSYLWIDSEGLSNDPLRMASNPAALGSRLHGWLQVASAVPASGLTRLQTAFASMTQSDCASNYFMADASIFSDSTMPPALGAYQYDAAVALILAAEAVAEPTNGTAMRQALLEVGFEGASGSIQFDGTALDRDEATVQMSMFNFVYTSSTIELKQVRSFNTGGGLTYLGDIMWPDGYWTDAIGLHGAVAHYGTQPVDQTTVLPVEYRNLLPPTLRIITHSLAYVTIVMGVISIAWTFAKRNEDIVHAAQPGAIALIAAGAVISSVAALLVTMDHADKPPVTVSTGDSPGFYADLDFVCSMGRWLWILGFDVMITPLITKMWRIGRQFNHLSTPHHQRRVPRLRAMSAAILALVLMDVGLLTAMQLNAPLYFKVTVVSTTLYGDVTESKGMCTSDDHAQPYNVVQVVIHGVLLGGGNVLLYKLRRAPSEFNESKFLGFALFNNLQASIILLMLMNLLADKPAVFVFAKWFGLYWTSTATLCIIFVPKVQHVHFRSDDEDDLAIANDMMKMGKAERRQRLRSIRRSVRRSLSAIGSSVWEGSTASTTTPSVLHDASVQRDGASQRTDHSRRMRKQSTLTVRGFGQLLTADQKVLHTADLVSAPDAQDTVATLASHLLQCAEELGETRWLNAAKPFVGLAANGSDNDRTTQEQTHTIAELIVDGAHLRHLRRRIVHRPSFLPCDAHRPTTGATVRTGLVAETSTAEGAGVVHYANRPHGSALGVAQAQAEVEQLGRPPLAVEQIQLVHSSLAPPGQTRV
mmetsp:Transcript_848/g.2602  ORF Transcript_848/g.2602 Transcript_848/m.2602 type:complete len:777 (+) Transcript_848:307-2637(+)